MTAPMLPRPDNTLVISPHYAEILKEYNKQYTEKKGKMNDGKFFKEFIEPRVPGYKLMTWYKFLRRWKDASGLSVLAKIPLQPEQPHIGELSDVEEQQLELKKTFLANEQATQQGIQNALNLGALFYAELWRKYSTGLPLTTFEQKCLADALFKAMKSQDSRIHAIGKIKQDNRDEERFNRAFGDAAGQD